ncbi:MAG: class I SAM-dependent methyltransferase [Bacteroidota bacterium]|nr:class I SAM-dependent methyltransferase [Bacteroidota bacterium]
MLSKLFTYYSLKARKKRAKIFTSFFSLNENTKILDLGGGDGSLLATTLDVKPAICIADIDKDLLKVAKNTYGFDVMELDESGKIPCVKNEFDIIFCNSVIEHVTIDKKDIYDIKSDKNFRTVAFERQRIFANEIRAKCDKYYVQTPYKYFPIESHSWLPGIFVLMPRRTQIKIIIFFNKFWPKKTWPDFNLLTEKEMKELFPEARIVREKSFLFTKSLIAIAN